MALLLVAETVPIAIDGRLAVRPPPMPAHPSLWQCALYDGAILTFFRYTAVLACSYAALSIVTWAWRGQVLKGGGPFTVEEPCERAEHSSDAERARHGAALISPLMREFEWARKETCSIQRRVDALDLELSQAYEILVARPPRSGSRPQRRGTEASADRIRGQERRSYDEPPAGSCVRPGGDVDPLSGSVLAKGRHSIRLEAAKIRELQADLDGLGRS